MRSSTCFILSALYGSQIVKAQWGAVAEPPEISLGNHYHWEAEKSLPVLYDYELESHLDFFKDENYDHDVFGELHHDVHRHAKQAEDMNLETMLIEEKVEDEAMVEYATHRTLTEHLYKTLDFLDKLYMREASKQWPDPFKLRRLYAGRSNIAKNI